MSEPIPKISYLKKLYSENRNIMGLFRDWGKTNQNSAEAILVSYDLQSGSYSASMKDPAYKQQHDLYSSEIAEVISDASPSSILEAGVGEATTLCSVFEKLDKKPTVVAGFDLAWSRIHFARQHAAEFGFDDFRFCTGQLENIPFLDNSFDVVYTAHAVEPNYGREEVILRELLRVAREKVILFEPSYELGGAGTRARIEEHGYCRGLPSIVAAIGGHIVSHKLLQNPISATNATAALVIEKPRVSSGSKPCCFACPKCALHLETLRGNLYCQSCAMVFPMIDGIPCLLPDNGILAAFYPVAR